MQHNFGKMISSAKFTVTDLRLGVVVFNANYHMIATTPICDCQQVLFHYQQYVFERFFISYLSFKCFFYLIRYIYSKTLKCHPVTSAVCFGTVIKKFLLYFKITFSNFLIISLTYICTCTYQDSILM